MWCQLNSMFRLNLFLLLKSCYFMKKTSIAGLTETLTMEIALHARAIIYCFPSLVEMIVFFILFYFFYRRTNNV